MIYNTKLVFETDKGIVVDDMLLTKDEIRTTAGSGMLHCYESLFEAEVITRLTNAGFPYIGKASVGEFAIDLVGETAYNGANVKDGVLLNAAAEILKAGEAIASVGLDVNGSIRRAAAQNGLVSVKPTYGTVSRYGTIPVACSGETVSVTAPKAKVCAEILSVIAGHDDKDGTSLPQPQCDLVNSAAPIRRVAVIDNMVNGVDGATQEKITTFKSALTAMGVEVCSIDNSVIASANAAWNILMCAELCNNVSRYDGVKYGYRSPNFSGLDELYTNSRTEAFGELLKCAILFGSDTLSTDNYMKVYDKALRIRRIVGEEFAKLFEQYDAVLLPACSVMEYTEAMVAEDSTMSFKENRYTAPASITGLPAVVTGGVQLVGKAFSELALLNLAKEYEKEAK